MWVKTTGDIADLINGELKGNAEEKITGVASLEQAEEGDIGYVSDEKYRDAAGEAEASALVVSEPINDFSGIQIICEDPEVAFLQILQSFRDTTFQQPEDIHERAVISPDANLSEGVNVGACAVVESGATLEKGVVVYPHVYVGHNVHIGEDTVIHPQVTLCEGVQIGKRCIIRPHAVIGDDGFGFIQREGASHRLQHAATVQIGDDVEVGAFNSVDRGMLEDTRIGRGVKMDSHCHVAHNCAIGDNCILVAYTRMAGSVTIGEGAVLAADVRVRDHVKIGAGAMLAAGTGVAKDVDAGARMWGTPARPLRKEARVKSLIGRLPELKKTVQDLQSRIETLEAKLDEDTD